MSISKPDAAVVSLSSLCLIHCLALPFVASVLPLFGVLSEAEWLHKALVLIATPISVFAFFTTQNSRVRHVFGAVAFIGTALLIIGAFVEALHDHETLLTVCGALTLAGIHLYRWQTHTTH